MGSDGCFGIEGLKPGIYDEESRMASTDEYAKDYNEIGLLRLMVDLLLPAGYSRTALYNGWAAADQISHDLFSIGHQRALFLPVVSRVGYPTSITLSASNFLGFMSCKALSMLSGSGP